MQRPRFRNLLKRFKWPVTFGLLAASLLLLAYAFTPISFPTWTASTSPAATTTSCTATFSQPIITASPSGGMAQFGCPGAAAFTVSTGGSDTAIFTLPTVSSGAGTVESLGYGVSCSSVAQLTSGQAVALNPGNYYLCLSYTITSGTATFSGGSFSWSS